LSKESSRDRPSVAEVIALISGFGIALLFVEELRNGREGRGRWITADWCTRAVGYFVIGIFAAERELGGDWICGSWALVDDESV